MAQNTPGRRSAAPVYKKHERSHDDLARSEVARSEMSAEDLSRSISIGTMALHETQSNLLRDVLSSQERTNELLEEMLALMTATQKQRVNELNQWKQAHPTLARSCHRAAEALAHVQVAFLNKMTEEINDSSDDLLEGEFLLNEFVDRFGPRLAHLNGVIQVLAQLSSIPNPTDTSRSLGLRFYAWRHLPTGQSGERKAESRASDPRSPRSRFAGPCSH